jgi:hypothetical protein
MKIPVFLLILLSGALFAFSQDSVIDIKYTRADDGLIIRSTPSTSGEKIDLIPKGYSIEVLEYSKKIVEINGIKDCWARVNYNDKIGWVFNGYLVPRIEYYTGVIADFKKNGARKFDYYFTVPGNIPRDYYDSYEGSSSDQAQYIPVTGNELKESVFGKGPHDLYMISEGKITKITDYKFYRVNKPINFFYAVKISTDHEIDFKTTILLSKKGYDDFKARHAGKKLIVKPLNKTVPIKNTTYTKIITQWTCDINGDGKDELISQIRRMDSGCYKEIKEEMDRVVVSSDADIIDEFRASGASTIMGILYIPFHNYPVLAIYNSSGCSGERGEGFFLYYKNSKHPLKIPINYTDAD